MRSSQTNLVRFLGLILFLTTQIVSGQSTAQKLLHLAFVDSSTGFSVQPEIKLVAANGGELFLTADEAGRVSTNLAEGDYSISIAAKNYLPISAAIAVADFTPDLQFTMDPVSTPAELRSESIVAMHRRDATVFVGFISGSDSRRPLENVRVVSWPSGTETQTDARGFFKILVPLQNDTEWVASPARLVFAKDGFKSEERQNLELSPYGDFVLRIALTPGTGTNVTSEEGKRIDPNPAPFETTVAQSEKSSVITASAINPTNATVRLPTNIRVQLPDGTIDYVSMETYVQRSLNDEWISSWGNLSGGSGINSLKAGAVAIRSYAAWFVRNPRGSTYDICATTSCQVYDTDTATIATTAAMQTAGYVVIDSNNLISRSEYSAENNSAGFKCGDGYTEPNATTPVCIYDPACAGEVRFGHGRGMCQWGTARWATGFRMQGRVSGDSTPNGFPKKDWLWLISHYYPALNLVKAQPFVIGDDIKALSSAAVRQCADGGIASGTNCPLVTTKAAGAIGTIIDGPVRVTADGSGFTWWKIQWSDSVVGWSVDNYLERIVPAPVAPTELTANIFASTRILLSWTDTNSFENGFRIERAYAVGGPFLQIQEVAENVTFYFDTNVLAGNTFFYRVRAFNVTGNSGYSPVSSASTPHVAPTLPTISNKTIAEGLLLTFTNTATVPDHVQMLADFEGFNIETPTGTVLFRNPRFSATSITNIDASPDYSSVTELFPLGSGLGTRALFVSFNFTNAVDPWLRLTTSSATSIGNPVIDFTKRFRFNLHSDKSIKVGLGLRETTTAPGTGIGANGGATGGIEWVGVTNKSGVAPMPDRVIASNTWTTLTFELPTEPVLNFASGNNVLSTASGLGVLEHLAIVPNAGNGIYKVHFDNFAVVRPRSILYSLDEGAPSGASIHSDTGVFSWMPTELQGPGVFNITVRATDASDPTLSNAKTFSVTVSEVNQAPVLAGISNRIVHAGTTLIITNTASDADFPTNTLTYHLVNAPSGAEIDGATGIFSWTPVDLFANSTNTIFVNVADNGIPPLSDEKSFAVIVAPKPGIYSISASEGNVTLQWSAIPGGIYRLQYKDDLSDPDWNDVVPDVVASENFVVQTDVIGEAQRFYRILLID